MENKVTSPTKIKQGIQRAGRLMRALLEGFRNREGLLPHSLLEGYVRACHERREILLQSASRFGTPQYFFDEPALSRQIARFQSAFSPCLPVYRLFYAMKSNPFRGICKRVLAEGLGLDASSGHELQTALALGCTRTLFSGPGKTDEELRLAVRNRERVTLLMDSPGELRRLCGILKQEGISGKPLRAGIRVQGKHHGIWNKFGIPLNDLKSLFHEASGMGGIDLCGIQFHASWNLGPEAQIRMIEEIGGALHGQLPEDRLSALKFIDIGGGFWPEQGEWLNAQNTFSGRLIQCLDPDYAVPLKHYYRPAKSLHYFAKEISDALRRQGPPLSGLEVWMEPGRWLSTPAMHILVKVMDKKSPLTAITDGGIHLLGWERPMTEFIPVINLTRPGIGEFPLNTFGSLCTPHDIWGSSVFGAGLEPGDILMIPDQGAYTYTLRQSFIKPKGRVVGYDGRGLEELEPEESPVPG